MKEKWYTLLGRLQRTKHGSNRPFLWPRRFCTEKQISLFLHGALEHLKNHKAAGKIPKTPFFQNWPFCSKLQLFHTTMSHLLVAGLQFLSWARKKTPYQDYRAGFFSEIVQKSANPEKSKYFLSFLFASLWRIEKWILWFFDEEGNTWSRLLHKSELWLPKH